MSSKLYRFIKPRFFILFFISFIIFFNKNYAQKCVDVTSKKKQKKLALQALASQSYLNNLVIRFDESKKKYVDTVYEMKDLTEAIEVGLVDLSKDVEEAIVTERSLIRTASGILEYQYSLNEQATSVIDFMLSASTAQKCILLDLDFEFLDDEIRKKINKYNIDFKKGFNPITEYYTNEIDELLGYVPGDQYATKMELIASEIWSEWSAYEVGAPESTSWHPSGDYVVITGNYPGLGSRPNPHLSIYYFDGTSLGPAINPNPSLGGTGRYRSIDWSSGGGYLVAGGSKNSIDEKSIRIFEFDVGVPSVKGLIATQYDPSPSSAYSVTSVAWHPDFSDISGGFFAVVGSGDGVIGVVKDIQIYKLTDLPGPPVTLDLVYSTTWGSVVASGWHNFLLRCSWSPDGEYLAVSGYKNNINQVLRIFKFNSGSGSLIEVASMDYDDFDFDVSWVSGVDWSPNGQYLALSSNFSVPTNHGFSFQIAMNAVGNAFIVYKRRILVHTSTGYKLVWVIRALRYDVAIGFWQDEAVVLSSSDYDSSEPQVAMNNNGDAIAVWQKSDDGGITSTIQANRYDASTGSWQSPDEVKNLSLSGQNASLPQIVMNNEGAIAVWQRPTGNPGETIIQASRYDGVSWQDLSNVTNLSAINEVSTKPQIAINDDSDSIVVWRSFDGGNDYAIQASKYDHNSCDWLSVDTIFSGTFPSIDNPQIAMSNEIAIIVWEGEETYFDPAPYIGKYYIVQARVNIISRGWENQNAWEPNLNKEPEELSRNSRRPQIAIRDYEGIAVWEYIIRGYVPPYYDPDHVIQAKKYILGQGWQSTKNLDTPLPPPSEYPQIAMDEAGNAIVLWDFHGWWFPRSGAIVARYNAASDSWGSSINLTSESGDESRIAMDRAGNAIALCSGGLIADAFRYNEVTGFWKQYLGYLVLRRSLKIVNFDVSLPEPLTFFTAWNDVGEQHDYPGGIRAAKWAPSGEAVAICSERVSIDDMEYKLVIFKVDFSSEILTLVEGGGSSRNVLVEFVDLAWRPDGKYISSVVERVHSNYEGRLDIFDLDYDYFGVVLDTYDGSIPSRSGTNWSNKGERDVGILSNILRQNQEKNGTKNMPVKFEVPGGYTGAADFINIINPACISADDGLTGILDASIEVTDSLLGARKRNYKFMQDNLKLSKRLTDVYKKSVEIKKTEQARVIDQSGVYTFNKDVQGVIVIDADNITLDLNGYKIFSDSKIPITVNKNIKNINIKNGSIIGGNQYLGAPSGVLVKEGAQHITLENLTITFCYEGVTFKGEQDCSVADCLVQDCAFKSNIKAASLDCSEYVTFKECEFLDCFLETVNLENNNKNCCQ